MSCGFGCLRTVLGKKPCWTRLPIFPAAGSAAPSLRRTERGVRAASPWPRRSAARSRSADPDRVGDNSCARPGGPSENRAQRRAQYPLQKLVLNQQNVRKTKAGVSIEELADDIVRRGLLTSLNVRPDLDAEGKETASIAFRPATAVTAHRNCWSTASSCRRPRAAGRDTSRARVAPVPDDAATRRNAGRQLSAPARHPAGGALDGLARGEGYDDER
jgi:hypothetical protein